MILIFSLLMWFSISPSLKIENVFLGIAVSIFAQAIGYRMYPKLFAFRFLLNLIISIPKVLYQSFKMILTKNYYTVIDQETPEEEIDEFSKVVNINFTPEEIVITKESKHLIVHKVSKK